jgi:predicted transcriptional regulator of viral defense system
VETKKNVSYLDFLHTFRKMGCFSLNQVRIWDAGFNRNNLGRWVQEGKLIHLRQGMYAFSGSKKENDAPLSFAGKIYTPSYISLHSALSFYGIIPEGVVQITSVTARKTAFFENALGQFSYQSMKPELIFGYTKEISRINPFYSLYLAFPEKALLDLLYLYPQYQSDQDMQELRLDVDYMKEEFNWARLDDYAQRFHSKSLEKRVKILAKEVQR